MTSPTQLSLKQLKAEGFVNLAVVEHWNPFAKIRQDLWRFADLLAICPQQYVLAVQCTTTGNVSHRLTKMRTDPILTQILACLAVGIRVEIHGWSKIPVRPEGRAVRWTCKKVEVTRAILQRQEP